MELQPQDVMLEQVLTLLRRSQNPKPSEKEALHEVFIFSIAHLSIFYLVEFLVVFVLSVSLNLWQQLEAAKKQVEFSRYLMFVMARLQREGSSWIFYFFFSARVDMSDC